MAGNGQLTTNKRVDMEQESDTEVSTVTLCKYSASPTSHDAFFHGLGPASVARG